MIGGAAKERVNLIVFLNSQENFEARPLRKEKSSNMAGTTKMETKLNE